MDCVAICAPNIGQEAALFGLQRLAGWREEKRRMFVLGAWFIFQVLSGVAVPTSAEGGGVAFWAHIGGFVAGIVLTPLFKRREVPLLEPPHSRSWQVRPMRRSQFPDVEYERNRRRSPWE